MQVSLIIITAIWLEFIGRSWVRVVLAQQSATFLYPEESSSSPSLNFIDTLVFSCMYYFSFGFGFVDEIWGRKEQGSRKWSFWM
jgi:hypothetical protein